MGTRSTIAIENADGTVTGIYCHWDGYVSNNGRILQESYTDEAKVRKLIALGNLSSLGPYICNQQDFDRAADQAAATAHNWRQFIAENGQEYDYLFTPGKGWQVRTYNGIYDLAAALGTETEEA